MARKSEVRRWQNEGLPPDPYSTENAILVKNGQRWPLLIDPHGQAYKWIRQMEGDRLRQVQASEPGYMKILENAIRLGESILLQDVSEDLDPSLKSVLGKEIYCRAGQVFIRLGDAEIEYNCNFRLYMSTQNPNPHFLPAVCITVTLISFTVTLKGLQDQLLSIVVTHEQPHLEDQRTHLLENISSDLSTLRELEERSLTLLQKTEGHILDDEDLIETLQKSKLTSKDILKRMEDSGRTEETIEAARGIYLPVAHRGAVLYFIVADLIHLNYMYQFSLHWFHTVFVKSMESLKKNHSHLSLMSSSGTIRPASRQRTREADAKEEEREEDIGRHLNNICDTLTRNVYKIVSSSLFTEHKLCFSFLLTVNIMKNASEETPSTPGILPQAEWDFFLNSVLLSNFMDKRGSPEDKAQHTPPWLSGSVWRQCQYLSHHLDPFSALCDSLSSDNQQWKEFSNSDTLYELLKTPPYSHEDTPSQAGTRQGSDREDAAEERAQPTDVVFYWEKLTSFQKLILIKILRPECLTSAVREFIAEKMGSDYVQSSAVNLKQALEESSNTSPLIFILSSGSDPAGELERLALEIRGSTLHLDMISLGRGQGVKAEELINKAKRLKGHWVFLQNCHLAASFMPRLREIVESFEQQSHSMDPQFRLWLSSRPDQFFPVSILQKGYKMAVEPPRGLKGKLQQMFGAGGSGLISEKTFEKEPRCLSWKKLLFSLCLFHAVLNERRKYGALGWNIPYEFTSSDLEVSVQMSAMLIRGREEIPWKAARYLTGEVVYGGRVTDFWDRRCLLSILDTFYNPAVLHHDYVFSTDKVYRTLAEDVTFWGCREYIDSLPDSDGPQIFGMHRDAERAYSISQAQRLHDTIISMQPRIRSDRVVERGDGSQDEMVLDTTSVILAKLPLTVERGTEPATMEQDKPAAMTDRVTTLSSVLTHPAWETLVKSTTGYDPLLNSALLTVLHQEIDRFNKLLSVIQSSLSELQQAVQGEIILNKSLEEVYDALASLRVPELWQRQSYESCKALGSWVEDLVQRIGFFSMWCDRVIRCVRQRFGQQLGLKKTFRPNSSQISDTLQAAGVHQREEPHSYWLPAFFFPQGFLMAVLQNYARQKAVSVDSLTFKHKVQPLQTPAPDVARKSSVTDIAYNASFPPNEGVLVFGLFLDSARWSPETQILEECEHQQRFYSLPQINFIPQKMESESTSEGSSAEDSKAYWYECPLYRTPLRAGTLSSTGHSTNFVTAVTLPTVVRPEQWIRRGVALLCQITE